MIGIRRFGTFAVVGAAGFIVDAGVLLALAPRLGPYGARLVSFTVAVTATWLLNRLVTFSDRRSRRKLAEWGRYVSTQIFGALTNLAIYAGSIAAVPSFADALLVPLAFGSAGGLLVNYCLAHRVAFPAADRR